MKLHRTGPFWDRKFYNEINDNWNLLEKGYRGAIKEEVDNTLRGEDFGFKNEVRNGNFNISTPPTGWWTQASRYTISNNTLYLEGTGSGTIPAVYQITDIDYAPGKKIYMRAMIRPQTDKLYRMRFAAYSEVTGEHLQYLNFPNLGEGGNVLASGVFTMPNEGNGKVRLQLRAQYNTAEDSTNQVVAIQDVLAIDLTRAFGEGKEPTKEQMDELINSFEGGWFDTVPNINELQTAILSYLFNQKTEGGGEDLKYPVVGITFDDGYRSDFDLAYPEFKKRGMVGTSYIWTDRTDNYADAMNLESLIELKLNGWGVECHTRDHERLGDLTDEEIHAQMQGLNEDFDRYGLPTPRHHALPFGSGGNVKRVQNIILQYRKTIRNIQSHSNSIYNDWDTIDLSAINAYSLDARTEEELKRAIDLTIENKGILVLITHKVVDGETVEYQTSLSKLIAVLDYIEEKGVITDTMAGIYRRVLEYRKFKA